MGTFYSLTLTGTVSVFGFWGLFYYVVRPSAMHINRSCWSPETIAKRATQLAAEVTVVRVDRRRFLVRLGGTTVVVTVIGAIVGELSQATHKRVSAANGERPLMVSGTGFQRIRYYGFLANRYREQKLHAAENCWATPPGNTNQLPQIVRREEPEAKSKI